MKLIGEIQSPSTLFPWNLKPTAPVGQNAGESQVRTQCYLEEKDLWCPCWESNPNFPFSISYPSDYTLTMLTESFVVMEVAIFTYCRYPHIWRWGPIFVTLNSVITVTVCYTKSKIHFSVIVSSTTSACEQFRPWTVLPTVACAELFPSNCSSLT